MTQRFYLHNAVTGDTGTLPATTLSDAGVGNVIASGANTNRSMDGTIGPAQATSSFGTSATTTAQDGWFRKFLSLPLTGGTYNLNNITCQFAASEGNGASNFQPGIVIAVWRPSTGTRTYLLWDLNSDAFSSAEAGTGETLISSSSLGAGAAISISDGDVLVFEIWRRSIAQTMATSYTNSVFYDGTTEGSTSNDAAFLDMGVDIPLFVGGGGGATPIDDYGQQGFFGLMRRYTEESGGRIWNGWSRRPSGVLVPA